MRKWLQKVKRLKASVWSRLALVLFGFALGALLFGARTEEAPHSTANGDAVAVPEHAQQWTCSMHPQIRQSQPGQCAICGMDLIAVASGDDIQASNPSRIVLSERAKALAKLRTAVVRRRGQLSSELRLLGRIQPDETTLKTVTAWIGGRIDRLHVSATGVRVRAGQAIATVYSPEVFSAHQDLLVARRQVERLGDGHPSAQTAARAALDAARNRLQLLGVPQEELQRMETQDQPTRAVSIRSPFSGTVLERLTTEGAYVTTGAPLYRIADLSRLWVQLDAYESDLSRIAVGQEVRVRVEALPGEEFEGKVAFIEPTLDATRRTTQVRVEVNNRNGRLRPGMFAATTLSARASETSDDGARQPLVVPATAPLFTGRRAVVYVEVQDGDHLAYEARTVRLGPRLGDYYPVVAGLSEGERVVVRGAFVVDADLQIKGGPSMMTGSDDAADVWEGIVELPAAERIKFAPILEAYLATQKALAEDDLGGAQRAARGVSASVARVEFPASSRATKTWPGLAASLRKHAESVAAAGDLESARAGFEALSEAVATLVRHFGNPLDEPLHVAFCPMAFGSRGATWLQRGETIDNAYFGASMRTCGEVQHEVAPGSYLMSPEPVKGERAPGSREDHSH